ncbi:MAG: hypothetical protein JNK43_00445 [Ignavibacteria bacterium]|nr:hypothetical protein [Ignavibacteria bacterium]
MIITKPLTRSLLTFLLAGILAYHYSGCSDETIIGSVGTPMFGGYDQNEAGVMMTLSALCYVAEGNTNALQIRDSINLQLNDSAYATNGSWEVCWGPGISPTGSNLLYMAVDSTGDSLQYAICVRGTVFNFANIVEDIEVWDMEKWPYTSNGDSIALGSLKGLDTLLATSDPVTNLTLQSYLNSLNAPKQKMFITGHSLGGAMATLITKWFMDIGMTSRFKLETYTFAAPTVGNVTFVNSYHASMIAAGGESHRCVNSKDVVPYAWAGLMNIISDNVPTTVPALVAATIQTAHDYLKDSIIYKHVETKRSLGTLEPANCGPIGEYDTYFCWVGFEHSSATYLRLLEVDTINWGRR